MMRRINKDFRVALLLVGSAILLCSCEEKPVAQGESAYDAVMTEYSENRTIIASENGVKQYRFFTPLLEGYTAGKEPYREFRKGIRMVTFKKDSTDEVDVTLTSNYAIYYENRKLWEAKGNVVVKKFDGKELYTEQLFWNDLTNKIYSNVDSKIVEPDGVFYVSGFESDEEFRFWSAREMDGEMQMEFTPTRPDSTALAQEEQREERAASPQKRTASGIKAGAEMKPSAGEQSKPTPRVSPERSRRPERRLNPNQRPAIEPAQQPNPEESSGRVKRMDPTRRPMNEKMERRPFLKPSERDPQKAPSKSEPEANARPNSQAS